MDVMLIVRRVLDANDECILLACYSTQIERRSLRMVISAKAIEILKSMPAATVYEAAGKFGDMDPKIRALAPGLHMAGPAFTLRTKPGDNTGVFLAIHEAPVGSVLVIDGGGTLRVTIWGGTSTAYAQQKGLAGCVTNAGVRDLDEILESRFPVFAPGISVRGTVKDHKGWIGIPVCVGDVTVSPGDFVVGDSDGVVVVPAARVEEVAAAAVEQRRKEQDWDSRIRNGESGKAVMGL
jgi:4-hydroxy-4-methyl-2-oxoglutarate aldolase